MASAEEPVKVYPCPLPTCQFTMFSEPPCESEKDTTLSEVFGFGIFGAIAKARRLEGMEAVLSAHLNTHGAIPFAIALAAANKRLAELTGGSQNDAEQPAGIP